MKSLEGPGLRQKLMNWIISLIHFKVPFQTTAAAQGEGQQQQQIWLLRLALPTEKMLV